MGIKLPVAKNAETIDVEVSADVAANIIKLHKAPNAPYAGNLRKLRGKWHVSIPERETIVGFSPITGGRILRGAPVTPTKPIGHRR